MKASPVHGHDICVVEKSTRGVFFHQALFIDNRLARLLDVRQCKGGMPFPYKGNLGFMRLLNYLPLCQHRLGALSWLNPARANVVSHRVVCLGLSRAKSKLVRPA